MRPITSILEVILYEAGVYQLESAFSLHSAPLFITIIYNVSITLALYGLVIFYMTTKKLLSPQRPLLKFISVKAWFTQLCKRKFAKIFLSKPLKRESFYSPIGNLCSWLYSINSGIWSIRELNKHY